MSELRELAEAVFGDAWDAAATGFDDALWATCEETGLARLTLPEAAGGSGGSLLDLTRVLAAAGEFAARVPLAETELAGWLLHAAGLGVPRGALSVVVAPELQIGGSGAGGPAAGGATVSGTLRRVPWGRSVAAVVALVGDRIALVEPGRAEVREGANLAEEPRDDLVLAGSPAQVAVVPSAAVAEVPLRAALTRSLLLAGAARGALAASVRYATERVQFGRPIGSLQAIQQELARAGAEVAAAEAASQAAALEAERRGVAEAAIPIAAAKVRCGEAAGVVARIAHQVHGAIGFTREHDLRLLTTRLWAWRDEDGPESAWADRLGARALEAGPDGLWPLLTGTP